MPSDYLVPLNFPDPIPASHLPGYGLKGALWGVLVGAAITGGGLWLFENLWSLLAVPLAAWIGYALSPGVPRLQASDCPIDIPVLWQRNK
jgi:hypothetical protein